MRLRMGVRHPVASGSGARREPVCAAAVRCARLGRTGVRARTAGPSGMTRVSIITPFLNAEPFIEESIKSVLAQTYENWELLLVDDGSTDASTAIALKYAAAHADK